MRPKGKIKTLIVDDSLLFRETLARSVSRDSAIEVVATASDPFTARDKIIEYQPDVMTLDIAMPRMNGIEFLRRLMPQYPLPVIMISAVEQNVFDALDAGAVDFVAKPDLLAGQSLEVFINELIEKIKIASVASVDHWKKNSSVPDREKKPHPLFGERIIAIGASTGGTEAVYQIIKYFPPDMPGTVVVQHMPAGFTKMYAERLDAACRVEVKEAQDGDLVLPGRVLIAPGNYHMRLKKIKGTYLVECSTGERISGHCPSVDALFHSVAEHAGAQALGIILTGMGRDGAEGLLAMRKKGARTIGQDEASSVVYGMPRAAYELGAVEIQCPLSSMEQAIYRALEGR